MGKDKWGKERGGQWQDGSSSQRWSAKQWQNWEKEKNKQAQSAQQPQATSFPGYQSVQLPAEDGGKDAEPPTPAIGEDQGPLIKELQRALNNSRRLDNKLRKLVEDRDRKIAQWRHYQQQLKETFLQQFRSYSEDLNKIDEEIRAVQDLQITAKDTLALIAEGKALPPAEKPAPALVPTSSETAALDMLFNTDGALDADMGVLKTGDAVSNQQVMRQLLRDMKEEHGMREELLRSQIRAMQNEIRDMKATCTGQGGLAGFHTPPLRQTRACPVTPPRPLSSSALGDHAATEHARPPAACGQDPYLLAQAGQAGPFNSSPSAQVVKQLDGRIATTPNAKDGDQETYTPRSAPRSLSRQARSEPYRAHPAGSLAEKLHVQHQDINNKAAIPSTGEPPPKEGVAQAQYIAIVDDDGPGDLD